MQKLKPENKKEPDSFFQALSSQDYKYFRLESELINGSNPSFQLSTLGYRGTFPRCWLGFGPTPLRSQEPKVSTRGRKDSWVKTHSLMATLPQKNRRYRLSLIKMKRELNPSPSNKPRLASTFGWAPHIKFLAEAKALRKAQSSLDKRWQNPSKSHYRAGHLK